MGSRRRRPTQILIKRDFADAPDGGWLDGTDSRTQVLFQLETIFLAWWRDPFMTERVDAGATMDGFAHAEMFDLFREATGTTGTQTATLTIVSSGLAVAYALAAVPGRRGGCTGALARR